VAIVAVLALAAATILVFGETAGDPIGQGSPAPAFALPRVRDGAPLSLSDLRGRVVLLNFWATWCKPCEDEMPAMERLYQQLGGADFELVAVSVDEDAAEVTDFVDRLALSFPVLLDRGREVSTAYQTFRYPESFLIDREGVVAARFVGPREWDSELYVERIRRLVAPEGFGIEPSG
jgi:peroxiredoxin